MNTWSCHIPLINLKWFPLSVGWSPKSLMWLARPCGGPLLPPLAPWCPFLSFLFPTSNSYVLLHCALCFFHVKCTLARCWAFVCGFLSIKSIFLSPLPSWLQTLASSGGTSWPSRFGLNTITVGSDTSTSPIFVLIKLYHHCIFNYVSPNQTWNSRSQVRLAHSCISSTWYNAWHRVPQKPYFKLSASDRWNSEEEVYFGGRELREQGRGKESRNALGNTWGLNGTLLQSLVCCPTAPPAILYSALWRQV